MDGHCEKVCHFHGVHSQAPVPYRCELCRELLHACAHHSGLSSMITSDIPWHSVNTSDSQCQVRGRGAGLPGLAGSHRLQHTTIYIPQCFLEQHNQWHEDLFKGKLLDWLTWYRWNSPNMAASCQRGWEPSVFKAEYLSSPDPVPKAWKISGELPKIRSSRSSSTKSKQK